MEASGKIQTDDVLEFGDGTLQRMVGPVAKASISEDATIDNAVNVNSVTWNSSANRYEIDLTGINYYYNEFATTVTPRSTSYPVPRTTSGNDDLWVYFDDGGQHDFHFVVNDLPSGTETTSTTNDAETTSEDPMRGESN